MRVGFVEGASIDEIEVGMSASYSQTITDADVKGFAGISGDRNPVHLDEEYAQESRFNKRIAHGLLSASFFSAILGTQLPGRGCVYASQTLSFKRPVYIGDTVTAVVTVTSVDVERKRVIFDTKCLVSGKTVISGVAEIFIP
ncbi:MaoC family dehydratase [Aquipseudomonas alcaligenes]|jgi:3-hydroxybutyryl-CoA dehydratase|uniref:3-hydroxybutyryl-CoA dehydratase n=1 Tax=Aquipseudomonas alcaligenes TaxID=43263 RepID=A0AA37CGQ0_AQUAC|nr:MaoC family dehydratase [Pseudomonas alcaligenes]BCR24074.1 3-hydroxybutyryl-CoA dehydratase [Pseudomonas alcaligenes]GIZ66484.1 3-hydroxybutyryl-CoA dehydratase [Pseudomonas alcaligenes]GIZ71088.1 3-hydroxybutyryl-CoA dehydratase [Pseudomonas alcaligenes]GIZ75676.1 3-hydroxybutyryl-CoA dehydratase [Pseudomonas alcaligenes]GIZ79737.1 3-hydroxybutyryl-CoA dehydratase [Pseudomonas alcaligenes]